MREQNPSRLGILPKMGPASDAALKNPIARLSSRGGATHFPFVSDRSAFRESPAVSIERLLSGFIMISAATVVFMLLGVIVIISILLEHRHVPVAKKEFASGGHLGRQGEPRLLEV